MTWIKTIDEKDAELTLEKIYSEISQGRGKISNILKIHSLLPQTMKTHLDLYTSIMFGKTGLKREQQELIATVVSTVNKCPYCINHHAEALNHYWKDGKKIKLLCDDFRKIPFSPKTMAMLEYAEKLTIFQDLVCKDDIQRLKEVGFSDIQILAINLTTAYFNFVNRIALGLGVEFDEDELKGYKY